MMPGNWGGDYRTRRATRLLLDYGIAWLPHDHVLWTCSLVGLTYADVMRLRGVR